MARSLSTLSLVALAGVVMTCSKDSSGPPSTPAQIQKVSGDLQSGTVGQALAVPLVVQANDNRGVPFQGATITFAVTQGGGAVGTASAATGADGRASSAWTLGTAAGTGHQVTATLAGVGAVTFGATAAAGAPATVVAVSGNGQTGAINGALPAAVVVRVDDQFANPVAGRRVDFTVTAGGGSVNPTASTTGPDGTAQTTWMLGAAPGPQTMQAVSAGLTGSPVPFGATAINLVITAVSPDTLIEGQSATLTGDGFDPTPANNTVRVSGVAATVTSATTTSLVMTVPASNCLPARITGVQVTVSGVSSNSVNARVHPAAFTNLAVGEHVIVQDPAQFCLQFRPSVAGGDAYIVGVGAAAESPTSVLPFTLTGAAGVPAAGAAGRVGPLPVPPVAPAARRPIDLDALARRATQRRAEQALRAWERTHLLAMPRADARIVAPRVTPPPSVGDTLRVRISRLSGDLCTSFTEVLTRVKVVGAAGVWVTDVANPPTDSLTNAEIQAYSDTFDVNIYAVDTLYFGAPSDLDANGRVLVVLSIEVNKIPAGLAGFVFTGDLFDRSACAASNLGEVFYGHVPDPANVAGTGARSKAGVVGDMPSVIAHEFAHNIQFSQRLVLNPGQTMTIWEEEGQAVLAEEVVGHSVLGNAPGQDYGDEVAFEMGRGINWYDFPLFTLATYYGWLPGTSPPAKAADAPELCTLFAPTTVPCDQSLQVYGAPWSFQRYVSDRFGPGYPGGEAGLHRDWIRKSVNLRGVANVEALLGVDFDSVFSQWAATLYVDGRVAGLAPPVTMSSWNLFDIFNRFASDVFRLIPQERTFASFAAFLNVRGGSTAYTRISAAGARPAFSIKARDAAGFPLGTEMRPQFWVVRLQ